MQTQTTPTTGSTGTTVDTTAASADIAPRRWRRVVAIVAIAAALHREDREEGNLTVLTQLMAGAAGSPQLGPRLRDAFDPWIDVVVDALHDVLSGSAYERLVPLEDLGYAVSALFLGAELLAHLDPDRSGNETLFASMGTLSELLQVMVATGEVPEPIDTTVQRIRVE